MLEIFLALVIFVALILIGFFAGSSIERAHYRSIINREEQTKNLLVTPGKKIDNIGKVESANLVSGGCVISVDYFKKLLASFRNMVGGRMNSYISLVDRAKREAILRMKEQAPDADMIINLRIETSSMNSQTGSRDSTVSITAFAYGTAIKLKK